MSQVNCVKHSVKQLRYVAHDVSLQGQCAVPLDLQGDSSSLTSSSNASMFVWELCYLRGTWVPYPQDTCLALEGPNSSIRITRDFFAHGWRAFL